MQMQRQSVDYSEASYCDGDTYENWGSRSSLTKSFPDEVTSQRTDSFAEELTSVRAERDSLVRALASERQRAASVAAAQDARLAELHGVIAELMRRRTLDKHSNTILEEETDRSDECDSTTQPAGELSQEDNADNDVTGTDRRDDETSQLSAADLPTPDDANVRASETSDCESCTEPPHNGVKCLSADRCCGEVQSAVGSSCERLRGSVTASPGGTEFRQAKLASRVKIKRTKDVLSTDDLTQEVKLQKFTIANCPQLSRAAEHLSREVCAAADVREAAVASEHSVGCVCARAQLSLYAARCARLLADVRVARAATQRAQDQAHRLMSKSAYCEGACERLRLALASADRALECYDSILALWETRGSAPDAHQRQTAEAVASQLLLRLESNEEHSDLLSPGPWLDTSISDQTLPYSEGVECRLREHAARLKAETVELRAHLHQQLFNYQDSDTDPNVEEMEAAIAMQEVCMAVERRAEMAARGEPELPQIYPQTNSSRRDAKKHWIETQETSETDL